MLWMRKIRLKTEGERKADISPRLMDRGNLNRFIKKNHTQQKGQFVTKTHTHTDVK